MQYGAHDKKYWKGIQEGASRTLWNCFIFTIAWVQTPTLLVYLHVITSFLCHEKMKWGALRDTWCKLVILPSSAHAARMAEVLIMKNIVTSEEKDTAGAKVAM